MGYILLSAMHQACASAFQTIVFSYDIACQFSKNFAKRMGDFPVEFRIDVNGLEIIFMIPKFHLPAHGKPCQVFYSFNFMTGAGRTYGEGIESNWAETNQVSLSTREMPSGFRHETLNNVFGAMNWRKTLGLGKRI